MRSISSDYDHSTFQPLLVFAKRLGHVLYIGNMGQHEANISPIIAYFEVALKVSETILKMENSSLNFF